MPRYFSKRLLARSGITRMPSSPCSKTNWSPGRTPKALRIWWGTVTWPLLVIFAFFFNIRQPLTLLTFVFYSLHLRWQVPAKDWRGQMVTVVQGRREPRLLAPRARKFRLAQDRAIARFAYWSGGCENRRMRVTRKIIFSVIGVGGAALIFGAYALAHQASTTQQGTAADQSGPGSAKASPPASVTVSPNSQSGSLATDKQKESYALGMNLARRMEQQPVELDKDALAQGFQDGLSGKTQLTDDEANVELKKLSDEAQANAQKKEQEAAEANMKEGEAFLAANKAKEGVMALPSGLQYKVEKQGTGPKPTASDTVVCNYRGTFIDGKEFDSSYKRGQPATFPVGGVIKGWTEALQLMPVGSKWELFIPPDLAYGARGAGGVIGPNATLVFEVELLSIKGK